MLLLDLTETDRVALVAVHTLKLLADLPGREIHIIKQIEHGWQVKYFFNLVPNIFFLHVLYKWYVVRYHSDLKIQFQ